MDGKPPAGRIVGLLDEYHLWSLLIGPHGHEWRSIFKIGGVTRVHVRNMIEYFVPKNDDGSTKDRDEVEREYQVSTSTEIHGPEDTFTNNAHNTQFQEFAAHTGVWAHHWDAPLAPTGTEEELAMATKNIELGQVTDWITKHGGITGRLRWFEAYAPHSKLYRLVAEPLLSVRTAGSIDVERAVKPMKNGILTRDRNRLGDDAAGVLMRASENLKILMKAKLDFKNKCA